jgi:hypothetical protein
MLPQTAFRYRSQIKLQQPYREPASPKRKMTSMKIRSKPSSSLASLSLVTAAIVFASLMVSSAAAQDQQIQQRLAELKESAARNKQALAQYTWREQQTIAIKGNVKDTKLSQVHIGPDGKPEKAEVENMPQSSGGRQHGLGHHIKEKKGEEYKEYGQQIAALAQQYAQLDPERLQQAFQQGNVMLGPAGAPGEVKMVISNYIKPNDKVTLVFNREHKAIENLDIATYLSDPKDAVTISALFSQLPDGTNHVASMKVNGVSKNLLITTENSEYEKRM